MALKNKHISLLVTKFPLDKGNSYLTTDLVDILSAFNDVEFIYVYYMDWDGSYSGPSSIYYDNKTLVYIVKPVNIFRKFTIVNRALKWLFTSFKVISLYKSNSSDRDLFISFSPLSSAFLANVIISKLSFKSVVIYWDFFPIHNYLIGSFPSSRLLSAAKYVERYVLARFDLVLCMSPRNKLLFSQYFKINNNVDIVPIWGSCDAAPLISDNENEKLETVFLFGGQLEKGRDIKTIINVAKRITKLNKSTIFYFLGSGSLTHLVQEATNNQIKYLKPLKRSEYIQFLKENVDVGLISVPNLSVVSSYPSKSLDYLSAGLPIIASLEDNSDLGKNIVAYNAGYFSRSGDEDSLFDSISRYLSLTKKEKLRMNKGAIEFYNSVHSKSTFTKNIRNVIDDIF